MWSRAAFKQRPTVTGARIIPADGVFMAPLAADKCAAGTFLTCRSTRAVVALPPPPSARGIVHCFQMSVREEGFSVLVQGLKACLVRAFLVNAAIFAAYESSMETLMRYGLYAKQPGDAAGAVGIDRPPLPPVAPLA